MSRSLIGLLLFLISSFLFSQNKLAGWPDLLLEPNKDAPYYHILSNEFDKSKQEVVRRLDEDNLIVKLKSNSLFDVKKMTYVNSDWKLNLNDSPPTSAFYIQANGDLNLSNATGLEVLSRYKNTYLVTGSLKEVHKLKHNPSVTHISSESARPMVEARVIDMNLNPNRINKIHRFFPELNGTEMVISIQENRYRTDDIDIVGRTIETGVSSTITDNHATEMATIIAGAGNSFLTGAGVAKNARLVSSDFSDVLPDDDSDYQEFNIQLQNHSYGTEIESFYGAQAQAFDQSAVDNPELQHVFSSGNQGLEVSRNGAYVELPGYANLTGNFKMAKNALVVGSVDTVGNTVPFTSNGPAYDGRVKPEVVAYSVVGSSNSAALVSGVSTLLQNQYRKIHSQNMPSSLLRALLINGAEDVGAEGLDFKMGYGSVDAAESLDALTDSRFTLGTLSEGEKFTFPLNLPADAVNLKVTLSWTDPASDIASFKALVNDLDLRVVNSSDEETLPWVLNQSPTISELAEPAIRALDRLNNNEQVTMSSPQDTNLTIEVSGFEVSGSQDFAVAYQYEIANSFEWDYPTEDDNMPYNGESGSYFRWSSTLEESVGRLEYSTNNGISWETLATDIDLNKGHWRWSAPFKRNTEAKARIVITSQTFETETFTISNPVEVSVGFICSDSVRLQWDKLESAVEYEVYNMGGSSLEFFASTADTALIIPDINALEDTRFSVVPVLASGKKLIPSLTLDITQQAIECFVFSFFQEVVLDSGIFLNLRLGTNYGIDKITFQRQSTIGSVEVETFDAPIKSTFRVLDKSPDQGNNIHWVVIDFINGERIEQEVRNTYFLTELPVLLFPNPSFVGEEVTVLTKELTSENSRFVVLDSRGLEVIDVPAKSTQISIPTFGLEPGMYYYKLTDGADSYTGRFVIR